MPPVIVATPGVDYLLLFSEEKSSSKIDSRSRHDLVPSGSLRTMRSISRLVATLALSLGSASGVLSQGGAGEGTAAITGLVLDGLTRAPLADALVYLSVEGGGGPQTRQLTDAKGRFAFVNLPAGTRYTLNGSKPGYLSAGYSRESQPGASSA